MTLRIKQLNKAQALGIFNGDLWRSWSDEEIVNFQLYQDRLCVPFSRFHPAVEKVLRRSVWVHEFGDIEALRTEYEGKRPAPSFEEIMEMIPAEKRVIVVGGGAP